MFFRKPSDHVPHVTIFHTILRSMLWILFIEIALLVGILYLCRINTSLEQNAVDILQIQTENRQNYLQGQMLDAQDLSSLAGKINAVTQAMLDDGEISLDTLDPEKFRKITRIGDIERVYAGIRAAKCAGLANIKLNTVLIRGFNDGEVARLLEFAEEHGLLLRLIEFMPLEDDVWTKEAFISGEEILSMLPGGRWIKEERGGTNSDGPAQYFVNEATGRRIGVIDAVSNHFCKSCNRLRVSAEGGLRTCLFSENETPLKDIIERRDAEELRETLLSAARAKPRCWSDVKTGTLHMSGIGG